MASRIAKRYVVAASIVLTTVGCDRSVDVSHVSELSAYQVGHSYVLLKEVFLLETDGVHGWPLAVAPDGDQRVARGIYNVPESIEKWKLSQDNTLVKGVAYHVPTNPIGTLPEGTRLDVTAIKLLRISDWFFGKSGKVVPVASISSGKFTGRSVDLADVSRSDRILYKGTEVTLYRPDPQLTRKAVAGE